MQFTRRYPSAWRGKPIIPGQADSDASPLSCAETTLRAVDVAQAPERSLSAPNNPARCPTPNPLRLTESPLRSINTIGGHAPRPGPM